MRRARSTQPTEKCRWSVPAFRRSLMSNADDEFERFWLCERTGMPFPVTQAECNKCEHWSEAGAGTCRVSSEPR